MTQTRKLIILIFDDVEVLDFCGPFEVFSVANRLIDPGAFSIFTDDRNGRADADTWRPQYLARSVLAFYALFGALCLVVASDLERYRQLVCFLGVAVVVMSVVFIGVDLAAGLPWWWSASEGPVGIGVGALMYFLARPVHLAPKHR